MNEEHYADIFRSVLGGRKWIIAVDVAAAATSTVEWLRELGAPDPFVIAGTTGTGDLPALPPENIVLLGSAGGSMMEAIREFYAATHRPLPAEVRRRLDAWDPDHEAKVLATFLDEDRPIGGRPEFGARPSHWIELEDKLVIDSLWDEVGVVHAPMRIIDVEPGQIAGALAELDDGDGVVVTGDNRQGWHGGAQYTKVVKAPADIAEAVDFLGARCDRARVMPFLVGVPCSIHGVVFPDYVLTVRPVEMVVLYEPAGRRFRYAGVSGYWDPPPADTAYMRDIAIELGGHLRSTIGYRGTFTIDGVLTADGFLPTELNPRAGGGLRIVTQKGPNAFAIHTLLVAGVEADWRPQELERFWRVSSREHRVGGGSTIVDRRFDDSEEVPIRLTGGTWTPATDPEEANGTLIRGPAAAGGFIRMSLEPGTLEPSATTAPLVAAAFALADRLWETGIGEIVPAADVRT